MQNVNLVAVTKYMGVNGSSYPAVTKNFGNQLPEISHHTSPVVMLPI